MKGMVSGILIALISLGVVIWQQGRLQKLEKELSSMKAELKQGRETKPEKELSANKEQTRSENKRKDGAKATASQKTTSETRDLQKEENEIIRKMFENPAGQAMLREEFKKEARSIYASLMERFELNKEEEEFFLNLVGQDVGEESTVGMKLLGAQSREESMAILEQMDEDQKTRKESIKEFLNNEEDFQTYERYAERQGEYQQISGIRSVMDGIGEPLDSNQESQLIEAMYRARIDSGMAENWEGRAGFSQHGRPGASARFEDNWGQMQNELNGSLGFLSEKQVGALQAQQEQSKAWIVMQIRMVEGMIEQARKQSGSN